MAGRGAPSRPIWVKQAEEAKLKEEEQKAAAARAAFDATFKDVDAGAAETLAEEDEENGGSDSDKDETQNLASKPIGPVDPSKCTAAGTGVAGGAAGAAASFVIVTKDAYGRRVLEGGAHIRVKVMPGVGVSGGGVEQEAVVKDHGDGTYTVTYAVAKRGDYMVSVECNGLPIINSPFPVFFSGVTAPIPLSPSGTLLTTSPFVNGVGQSPFPGVMPGMFPANFIGLIPGAAGANIAGLSQMQMPLPPSAAAMAAAQSIMVARAYEAAQARAAAQESSAFKEAEKGLALSEEEQKELLSRTLQVSNLSPLLSADQLKTLFGYCGTVSECKTNESKQLAFVEYAKPEDAKAALALNNMEVGGRPINVEMAKSLPSKKPPFAPATNGLPVMMQQAVAMQQFQFQQALLVQQAVASQQAALQAATVKSASEMSAARAAEISKSLKGSGNDQEEKDACLKRSPSQPRRSRSRSPIRYRRRHRSRSLSRSPIRYRRGRRSRSRSRDRYRHASDGRGRARFYRRGEDYYRSQTRHYREWDRERDYEPRSSRRSRSPSRSKRRSGSRSPRTRKDHSRSPPRQRNEERSENARSSHTRSRVKEGHQNETHDVERIEKTSSRKDETVSPSLSKDEKAFNEHRKLSNSPSKDLSPGLGEIPESEEGKVAFEHEFEVKQPAKAYNDGDESIKASEGEDDSKEKRRLKKKHRKDEDSEKHDKRRKRHKHRRCRSPSDSADGLPSVEGGKSRVDSDDGSGLKKGHKKKSRPSRSASFSNSGSD